MTLQDSPLSLSQPLQPVLLCFCGLLNFGLQLLLLADDLLLLQGDLLGALHHLDLHLFLFDALLGFGHLLEEAGTKSSSKSLTDILYNLTLNSR